MNPSSIATASVVVITATTLVRRMREGKWQSHIIETIVFGFLLLVALLILAIVVPPAATILSYLGLVGAFVLNGPAVFGYVGDFGRGKGRL